MPSLEEEVSIKFYADEDYIVFRVEIHNPTDEEQAILKNLMKKYLEEG